ncbi:MAG TPA: hypothetical protein VG675_12225 [Bryobacteraceae bacterium]|nr:hypothetical protein [Bryobacteraceae bacterium]
MLMRFAPIFVCLGALYAQQVAAPTPETVGSPRGQDSGGYNFTNSFELGYRWSLIGGDEDKYRSDVNYGNGVRLLGSSFTVNSKDGHGRYFDTILLNTQGLGNDPYESAVLRVEKNRLYRYDFHWRLNDYFNPALPISAGLHQMDTQRRWQDQDLTLLPQSPVEVHLGYSRNLQDGPALSSVQEFNSRGPVFPIFMGVRREWNEYRLGADVNLAGFKFTVLRRWDFFKDDSPYTGGTSTVLGAPTDPTVLQQFQRSEPYHGSNPGWLGNLFTSRKHWAMNARMTYNSGERDFILDETAIGTDILGPANHQITVGGNASRPVMAGDFSFSFFPTDRLTVVNSTSIYSGRTVGDSTYNEIDNATNLGVTVNFRYLGVRTVNNSTDVNYRVAKNLGVYAGYSYSARLIRTEEGFSLPDFPDSGEFDVYERNNHLNSFTAGVRYQPIQPLTINVEGEVGRANQPLTPFSDAHYHLLGGRVQYHAGKLQLGTYYHQLYNFGTPDTITVFSSRSRTFGANGSWSFNNRLTLDASYSKLHLDSLSGLAFFAGDPRSVLQTGFSSLFVSNIHSGSLMGRIALTPRADLFVGYNITLDTGDGRASAVPAGVTDPIAALLDSVQTYPLNYQSPLARLSIKITPKIRWNAGWELYLYHEEFGLLTYVQNYRAQTGYTSILWSF